MLFSMFSKEGLDEQNEVRVSAQRKVWILSPQMSHEINYWKKGKKFLDNHEFGKGSEDKI